MQVPKQSPRSLNGSATSLSSLDANAGSHSPSSPRSSKAFGKSIIANGDPQMLNVIRRDVRNLCLITFVLCLVCQHEYVPLAYFQV